MKKETKIKKESPVKKENKENKKIDKKNKKMKKEKTNKDKKKTNKFLEIIKKKWLINTSKTILLVAIILAFFIGTTVLIQNLELTPIDFTEEKLFTLTEESKEQVKNIDKDINIYFVGFSEEDSLLDLAKQYNKTNEKINVEVVTATDRPDLVEKYGIETSSQGIIVESGEKNKVLATSDLYTYDYSTYIAEEKLTAAIKSVTVDKLPKVYFLSGYSSLSLNNGMQYLNMYLQNEVNEVETLDILSKGKVPDDCNALVITSPEKDFDDVATNALMDYINNGGNILWLNEAKVQKSELSNVNKILARYGVEPFEVGIIRETDSSKMVYNLPNSIMPEIQYSDVTSKIYGLEGVVFDNATKINTQSDEKLEERKITKTDLILTGESAYFRSNFENIADTAQKGEETGAFLVGAQFDKVIKEANEETGDKGVTSKLIIFGENFFISDIPLVNGTQTPMIAYGQNKDLVLNSIAYLSNREEDITVRKSTGTVTYTATEQENNIILAIIIAVPLLIIVVGIVVWIRRRRKK